MRKTLICLALTCAVAAGTARAEEKATEFSLGLSYLATTGNSDSNSGGLDLSYKHTFHPWGIAVTGSYLRAESEGVETANRAALGVRGDRDLGERWQVFAAAGWLRDTFAGLDSRYVVSAGVTFKAVKTEVHELTFDLGAAYNSEELTIGGSNDYASGVLGLFYGWTISPNAKLTERLLFVPSFKDSEDWRVASDTALEAAVSAKLAVKLGFQYLFDNVPVPGFEKTDTKTSASLVIKL